MPTTTTTTTTIAVAFARSAVQDSGGGAEVSRPWHPVSLLSADVIFAGPSGASATGSVRKYGCWALRQEA
jgi:hypothetical protein